MICVCIKLCKPKRVKLKDGRTVLLRRPEMKDLRQMTDYINSFVDEQAMIQIYKRLTLATERKWLRKMLAEIRSGRVHLIVAELDGKIVSITNLTKGEGRCEHVAEYGISVLKGYRRLGIATAISKRIIEIGKKDRNIKVITLQVYVPNKGAIRMYRKLGFRTVARLPRRISYKGKLIDEFIMDMKR
ncbi:MAG: GNAT family N-acetyltransferase [Candidatus Aenigmarchaeota archaeon]|nr:GNAT family N-acetyltransferase [Candidatus Aenigmarchaeota archaeon]